MKRILPLFILLILIVGCEQVSTDVKIECCQECSDSFAKSPIGAGPDGVNCGGFSSDRPLSEFCKTYFEETLLTVSDCV